MLGAQIDTRLHEREGEAVTNLPQTLPPAQSDLAQKSLKDPHVSDFLTLGHDALERDLELGLVAHVQQYLLGLGVGFAVVATAAGGLGMRNVAAVEEGPSIERSNLTDIRICGRLRSDLRRESRNCGH